MITVLEEAQNMADGIAVMTEAVLFRYEGNGDLTSCLWLIHKNMEQLCDLLAIIDAGEEREARTALDDTAQASAKTNQSQNITYHEMMSKQYNDSEGLNEIPTMSGTNDALDELMESAPKRRAEE